MLNINTMPHDEALAIIGGSLSNPSKMPWLGFSISATKCITGGKLRKVKGSTCEKCYALKGHYTFNVVKRAHARRLAGFDDPRWPLAMAVVIKREHDKVVKKNITYGKGKRKQIENRFRWFDSGDLQSVKMLQQIVEVCNLTPWIVHYMPSREIGIVADFLKQGGVLPKNLILRLSSPLVGVKPKAPPLGLQFSTVGCDKDKALFQCPAMKQGNKCLDCDACWKLGINVNYHLH